MNQRDKLVENTILSLQGKLTESSNVDQCRQRLDHLKEKVKDYDLKGISRSNPKFQMLMQNVKECVADLKEAIAEEKGKFVKPITITNILKKSAEFVKFGDNVSGVRGFHTGGKGDFEVNTEEFRNSWKEEDLYYEIEFYGKDTKPKKEKAKSVLEEAGFDVKDGSTISSLYVSCYRK